MSQIKCELCSVKPDQYRFVTAGSNIQECCICLVEGKKSVRKSPITKEKNAEEKTDIRRSNYDGIKCRLFFKKFHYETAKVKK